jgi:hypothetical protein
MMSLHSSMHSSQMNTDGPAMSLRDLVLALAAEGAVQQLLAAEPFLSAMRCAASGARLRVPDGASRPPAGRLSTDSPVDQGASHLVDEAVLGIFGDMK